MIDIEEDDKPISNPTHDARLQYYKLWMGLSAKLKESAIMGDIDTWFMSLRLLFTHVYAMLDAKEQADITVEIDKIGTMYSAMKQANRRDANLQLIYMQRKYELENHLLTVERLIYVAMNNHNMLLPRSAGDEELTLDMLDEESG